MIVFAVHTPQSLHLISTLLIPLSCSSVGYRLVSPCLRPLHRGCRSQTAARLTQHHRGGMRFCLGRCRLVMLEGAEVRIERDEVRRDHFLNWWLTNGSDIVISFESPDGQSPRPSARRRPPPSALQENEPPTLCSHRPEAARRSLGAASEAPHGRSYPRWVRCSTGRRFAWCRRPPTRRPHRAKRGRYRGSVRRRARTVSGFEHRAPPEDPIPPTSRATPRR